MQIKLSPFRSDKTITVSRAGDVLIIDGDPFDFTQLPEGATLPEKAIGSAHFEGPVERISGVLHLTIRLPHGAKPSQAVAFPQPIMVTQDGPVGLPE